MDRAHQALFQSCTGSTGAYAGADARVGQAQSGRAPCRPRKLLAREKAGARAEKRTVGKVSATVGRTEEQARGRSTSQKTRNRSAACGAGQWKASAALQGGAETA